MKSFSVDFAARELKKNTKLFRGEALLVLFTALLLTLVLCLGESISDTVVQHRFDAYGSFRYSIEGESVPEDFFESFGNSLKEKGTFSLCAEDTHGGIIGAVDDSAVQLGRITTIEGRLPENEGEIAAEMSTLTAMGYSYDIGQTIELSYLHYILDENGRKVLSEEMTVESFALCGVLPDRALTWSANIPSVFVSADDPIFSEGAVLTEYLLDMPELSDEEAEALGVDGLITKNTGAYPRKTTGSTDAMMKYVILSVCIVCAGLLLVTIMTSVRKRDETWRTLRKLGCDTKDIFFGVFLENLYISAAMLPLGAGLGVLCAWGVSFLSTNAFGYRLSFKFSVLDLIYATVFSTACVLIGTIIASFAASRTKMLPVSQKKSISRSERKGTRKHRKVGVLRMMTSRMGLHPLSSLCVGVITVGAMAAAAFLLMPISDNINSYNWLIQYSKNSDYTFDASMSYGQGEKLENAKPYDDGDVNMISEVFGVEDVFAYSYSSSQFYEQTKANAAAVGGNPENVVFTADLSGLESDYINELRLEKMWQEAELEFRRTGEVSENPKDPDMSAYGLEVMGVKGEKEIKRYLKYSEGGENADVISILSGESCILVLPPLYKEPVIKEDSQIGEMLGESYFEELKASGREYNVYPESTLDRVDRVKEQGYTLITEDTIKAGNALCISCNNKTEEVTVAAALRGLPLKESYPPNYFGYPFMVITGTSFFGRYTDHPLSMGYNYLTVKCSPEAEYTSTDKRMSQMASSLKEQGRIGVFSNNRTEKEERRTDIFTSIILSFILIVLYIMMTLVIFGLVSMARMEENRKRIGTYKMLGASDKKISGSFALEGIMYWIISCILAVVLLYVSWTVEDIGYNGFIHMLRYYLFSRKAAEFNWLLFAGFAAVLLAIIEFFQLHPLRKFFKQSPAEQMTGGE